MIYFNLNRDCFINSKSFCRVNSAWYYWTRLTIKKGRLWLWVFWSLRKRKLDPALPTSVPAIPAFFLRHNLCFHRILQISSVVSAFRCAWPSILQRKRKRISRWVLQMEVDWKPWVRSEVWIWAVLWGWSWGVEWGCFWKKSGKILIFHVSNYFQYYTTEAIIFMVVRLF